MEKQCRTCKITKEEAEFSPCKRSRGGKRASCRECNRVTDRKRDRLKYAENRDKERARAREKNKLRGHLINPKRDPFKRRAALELRKAIVSKQISKPKLCQQCGWEGRIHGHHEDYSKPLDVEWLCSICHGLRHRK